MAVPTVAVVDTDKQNVEIKIVEDAFYSAVENLNTEVVPSIKNKADPETDPAITAKLAKPVSKDTEEIEVNVLVYSTGIV